MKLKQLNEFKLFGKEFGNKKSYPKVTWKVKDKTAHFNLTDFKKAYVFKYDENFGMLKKLFGQYHIFANGKAHTFKGDYKTLTSAIQAFIDNLNELIDDAVHGKTETSPADFPKLKLTDFNLKQLEKDLN